METKFKTPFETLENLNEISERIMTGETTMQIEMGLTDDEVEAIYMIAYNHYNQQKYEESAKTFSMLMLFNPLEYKYLFGAASAYFMVGLYEDACIAYLMCTGLESEHPEPWLHMAECLIKVEQSKDAREPLEKAIEVAGDAPEYEVLVSKAQLMLDALQD